MATSDRAGFKKAFIERTIQAREGAKFSQPQMAVILGIKQDRYKHYEGRSVLPHYFIVQFCAVTRISIDWLFTGERMSVSPSLRTGARPVAASHRSKQH